MITEHSVLLCGSLLPEGCRQCGYKKCEWAGQEMYYGRALLWMRWAWDRLEGKVINWAANVGLVGSECGHSGQRMWVW